MHLPGLESPHERVDSPFRHNQPKIIGVAMVMMRRLVVVIINTLRKAHSDADGNGRKAYESLKNNWEKKSVESHRGWHERSCATLRWNSCSHNRCAPTIRPS